MLTALGIEKRKDDDLSGTSVVEVDQLQRSGETGVLQWLSGKASGVQITRNSGDPGSGAYIQIRGQNTINGDNSPLIILDGNFTRALDTPGNSAVYASYFLNDGDRVLLNTDDGGRFSQTSSMKLASYVENQLILAEAKFKTGNEAGAREHLNNVRADLRVQYGSGDGFPDSDASGNLLLKQILEEKYLALIGELVTFHDLRRTRNFIGVPNKPTGSTGASDFPQRFLYPQSEVDTNENIPSPLPEFFTTTSLLSNY